VAGRSPYDDVRCADCGGRETEIRGTAPSKGRRPCASLNNIACSSWRW
jgi:hypothetical protein